MRRWLLAGAAILIGAAPVFADPGDVGTMVPSAKNAVLPAARLKILPAIVAGDCLQGNGGGTDWITGTCGGGAPIGPAGGVLSGTYPDPSGFGPGARGILGAAAGKGVNIVTDYGADPTFAADSTTAIQNAVNAVCNNAAVFTSSEVDIPIGIYKITAPITITAGCTIRGQGVLGRGGNQNASLFRGTSKVIDAFVVKTQGAVRFENIQIDSSSNQKTGFAYLINNIFAAGATYAVNDTVTLATTGGTCSTAPILTVTAVSGGTVTGARISTPGVCTVAPTMPATQASTSGGGTGAQFQISFAGNAGIAASGQMTTLTAPITSGTTISVAAITNWASGTAINIIRDDGTVFATTQSGTPSGTTLTLADTYTGVVASSGNQVHGSYNPFLTLNNVHIDHQWDAIRLDHASQVRFYDVYAHDYSHDGINKINAVCPDCGDSKLFSYEAWDENIGTSLAGIELLAGPEMEIVAPKFLGSLHQVYVNACYGPSGTLLLTGGSYEQPRGTNIKVHQCKAGGAVGNIGVHGGEFSILGAGFPAAQTMVVDAGSAAGWVGNISFSNNIINNAQTSNSDLQFNDGTRININGNVANNNSASGGTLLGVGANATKISSWGNNIQNYPTGRYGTISVALEPVYINTIPYGSPPNDVGGIAIGTSAAGAVTTANNSVAIGASAAAAATSASVVAVGPFAAATDITGSGVVAIGNGAGRYVTGSNWTAIGGGALTATVGTPVTGNYNTALGSTAMGSASGGAARNTAVGQASCPNVTGNNNICLGDTTGATLTSGGSNILVGRGLDVAAGSTGNTIQVGIGATPMWTASGTGTPSTGTSTFHGSTIAFPDSTTFTVPGTFASSQAFSLSGTLTPTALAADANDYDPTNLATATTLRIDGGAADRNITGLAGGADGRIITIVNIGSSNSLTLVNQSASSSAANRFLIPGDTTLPINTVLAFRYDGTSSRWRPWSRALSNTVTAGTCTNCDLTVDAAGRITAKGNGAGGSGSGGGMFGYSGGALTLTAGTRYVPVYGSDTPSTTEADYATKSPSATVVANLQVNLSVDPGSGQAMVITLRKGGADTALTCTITGPLTPPAAVCQDVTNSVTIAQNDLIDWKVVTTGTYVSTPSVTILASNGTTNVGVTSVALGVPGSSIFGVTGSPVTASGTLAFTTTGTSGGVPYFSSNSVISSSALLTANGILLGGGAATAPGVTAAMTDGQVLVGQTSAAPLPKTVSGDGTMSAAGAFTIGANAVTLAKLATQATNTVLGNVMVGTAVPTALAVGTCSTSSSALLWTTNTGFGCNTSINASTLGSATFAAPGAIGGGTAASGAFTTLSASSTVSGTGFSTYLASPPAIGGSAAAAGTFTALAGTSGTHTGLTSLGIRDTSAAFDVTIAGTSSTTLTAGRVLTLDMVNAAQTLKFGTAGTKTFPDGSVTLVSTGVASLSSLTTVGALASGSIASGFGTISTGNTIATTAALSGVGGTHTALTGLGIRDTSAAFDVTLAGVSSTALSAGRILTLDMKNVAHTLAFGATANTITFPPTASYTLVGSGDTGTVTNTMLAGSIDLTAKVTGVLPYANGGTGATTLANHGVVVAGASAQATVSPGTSGNVLTSNGTDWTSAAAGGSGAGVQGGQIPLGMGDNTTALAAVHYLYYTNAAFTAPRTKALPDSATQGVGDITIIDSQNTLTLTNTLTLCAAGTDTVNGGAAGSCAPVMKVAGSGLGLHNDGAGKWQTTWVTTLDSTTIAFLNVNQAFTKGQAVTPVALTDGANIAVDASLGNDFTVTLAGNRTLDNPSNLKAGQTLNFWFTQDGTGTRVLTYGSQYQAAGSVTTLVLSTAANSVDLVTCRSKTTSVIGCSLQKAFSH